MSADRTTRTEATPTPTAANARTTPPKAGAPRSRKGAATRARLVDAARVVFERDGFLAARVSDIAKEAGLSHGSYYHYFDSKEQLFREVAARQEERLTAPPDDTEPAAGGSAATPAARIRAANLRYFERYREAARLMGVVEQVSRYDEQVNAARMATQRHFAERSEQAIRRWQVDGLVDPDLDPVVAADALGAMTARFAELWLVQGYRDYDFDGAVDQVTRLWVNALGLTAS